jgi:hypothetical protein
MKIKSILKNLIKILITVLILYYLNQKGLLDFSRVKSVFNDKLSVSIVVLAFLFCNYLGALRWQLLLRGQNLHLKFKDTFSLTWIGIFFNTALPGAVSGDVVKGYYIVRKQADGKGKIKAFTTLLLDRLLGLSALVIVSFVAMIFNQKAIASVSALKPLSGLITIIFFSILIFYVFVLYDSWIARKVESFLPKLPFGHLFEKFFSSVKAYENNKRYILYGLLISICIHLILISCFRMLALKLPGFYEVSFSKIYFLVPFGMLVTAIPIAPAGLGTGHAAFAYLFHLLNISVGADAFTAYVSFQLLMSLIGGVFYLRYKDRKVV